MELIMTAATIAAITMANKIIKLGCTRWQIPFLWINVHVRMTRWSALLLLSTKDERGRGGKRKWNHLLYFVCKEGVLVYLIWFQRSQCSDFLVTQIITCDQISEMTCGKVTPVRFIHSRTHAHTHDVDPSRSAFGAPLSHWVHVYGMCVCLCMRVLTKRAQDGFVILKPNQLQYHVS